jgi:enamine deaminase RidA (YjgF/YER057c/UK114 family)
MLTTVQPASWPRPRGYANGVITEGRLLHVAGQIGWDTEGRFASPDLVPQFAKALENVLEVVRAAGGGPEHVASLTIFVTDLDAYRVNLPAFGEAYRSLMGKRFPAMALVGVAGLVEREAKVEILAVAVLPPEAGLAPRARQRGRDLGGRRCPGCREGGALRAKLAGGGLCGAVGRGRAGDIGATGRVDRP